MLCTLLIMTDVPNIQLLLQELPTLFILLGGHDVPSCSVVFYNFTDQGHSVRGCLHDTSATFILVRVHSGSLLCLCIHLHDTSTTSHTGASHTGSSSPQSLYQSKIFISVQKLIPVSYKCGATVGSVMKSLSWGSACVVHDI